MPARVLWADRLNLAAFTNSHAWKNTLLAQPLLRWLRAMPADDLFDQVLAKPSGQWARAQ
jgi:hypothetical protein